MRTHLPLGVLTALGRPEDLTASDYCIRKLACAQTRVSPFFRSPPLSHVLQGLLRPSKGGSPCLRRPKSPKKPGPARSSVLSEREPVASNHHPAGWATLVWGGSFLATVGCTATSAPVVRGAEQAVPSLEDGSAYCADVGVDARACWGSTVKGHPCANGRCRVTRATMRGVPPEQQRCSGQRNERFCLVRSNQAGPFRCADDSCVQSRPHMPDAGEWLCVEMDGVAFCKGTGAAAGMEPGILDPALICGQRRGYYREQICVDLSPDPPPMPAPYACHFDYSSGAAERICTASDAPQVGTPCESSSECPRDSLCVGHICLPPRPEPACWLNNDCPADEHCRWGSCAPGHG